MFCPQCGQQQVSGEVRFCSRCGLALNLIAEILAGGGGRSGTLPEQLSAAPPASKLSPRQKGIRQGAMLMLSTLLVVPLAAIITKSLFDTPAFAAITAILCFVGGLLRIFYALFFEEKSAPVAHKATPFRASPAPIGAPARGAALPPPHGTPVPSFLRPQPTSTSELIPPPSVTDHTTRFLKNQRDINSHEKPE